MIDLLLIPIFSVANRARGSRAFNLVNSTVAGRLVGMGAIAVATSMLFIPDSIKMLEAFVSVFAGMMLWATPAWDAYWSAQIGNDPHHSKAWGCGKMFLRQLLILPAFLSVAYLSGVNYAYCSIAATLWLPYLIYGAIYKPMSIEYSEYTIGAMIGLAIVLITHGV